MNIRGKEEEVKMYDEEQWKSLGMLEEEEVSEEKVRFVLQWLDLEPNEVVEMVGRELNNRVMERMMTGI